jgi:hypothetical protein
MRWMTYAALPAVDEGGELAQPLAEHVAHGGHAQHHVQVGAALADV